MLFDFNKNVNEGFDFSKESPEEDNKGLSDYVAVNPLMLMYKPELYLQFKKDDAVDYELINKNALDILIPYFKTHNPEPIVKELAQAFTNVFQWVKQTNFISPKAAHRFDKQRQHNQILDLFEVTDYEDYSKPEEKIFYLLLLPSELEVYQEMLKQNLSEMATLFLFYMTYIDEDQLSGIVLEIEWFEGKGEYDWEYNDSKILLSNCWRAPGYDSEYEFKYNAEILKKHEANICRAFDQAVTVWYGEKFEEIYREENPDEYDGDSFDDYWPPRPW